jgi:hypothetical protein
LVCSFITENFEVLTFLLISEEGLLWRSGDGTQRSKFSHRYCSELGYKSVVFLLLLRGINISIAVKTNFTTPPACWLGFVVLNTSIL